MDTWTLSDLATPWCVHVAATLRVADAKSMNSQRPLLAGADLYVTRQV